MPAHPALPRSRSIAILGAGPLYLLWVGLFAMIEQPDAVDLSKWLFIMAPMLAIVGIAMLVGALIAVGPILVGFQLMRWLGVLNPGFRHPAMWTLAGGALCGAATAAMQWDWDVAQATGLALIATGATCAAIASLACNWDEPH